LWGEDTNPSKSKNTFEKLKTQEFTSKRITGIRTMLPYKTSQNSH
jgi:hypothetical protein